MRREGNWASLNCIREDPTFDPSGALQETGVSRQDRMRAFAGKVKGESWQTRERLPKEGEIVVTEQS